MVTLEIKHTLTTDSLIYQLVDGIDLSDAAKFIAQLTADFVDLNVTIDLIRHFKAMEEEIKRNCNEKCLEENGYSDFSAKSLL